jgi:decaprenylphospho-beta-D-ribofuranose 2-oxidase
MKPFELNLDRLELVQGYGQTDQKSGFVFRPTSVDEIREIIKLAKQSNRQITLRGAGRSYGDANTGSEMIILDIQRMNRILDWDPETGVIDCESGVTIEDLWRYCMEDGYWPPVVTGTMFPTLGGALGVNVHGKNNYCKGTLGEHVVELDVLFASGELQTLTQADALFYQVISSAGQLGIITRVKLKMHPVKSGNLDVYAESASNWREQIQLFEKFESNSDYMVSWIDCFGKGSESGRGLFHAAWYLKRKDHQSLIESNQDLPSLILGFFPKSLVWKILKIFNHRLGMKFINWAKYFSGTKLGNRKHHAQSLVAFSFLLDYVPDWRKAYEPGGFIQYQSFVPKESAEEVFTQQVLLQQQYQLESFLGVMKRHRPDKFLFSHAVDGYSLALDFKVTDRNRARLFELAHKMNEIVLRAGGKFYFAKDSTLQKEDLAAYLGDNLNTYRELKAKYDPDRILSSDLAKRLGL